MIETAVARELSEQLREVEQRLERLLSSGWRQAQSEAADLQRAADGLADAGLTEIAARVKAVAAASSAAEALPAIALAASASRMMRLRLASAATPEDWQPLEPAKARKQAAPDVLNPVARLLLDGREVWACARMARGQWLLVEAPFPSEPAAPEPPRPATPTGIFGRLKQQIGQAFTGGAQTTEAPSPWLNHLLRGRLVWKARHPLGAEGHVTVCTLSEPDWITKREEHDRLLTFREMLRDAKPIRGAYVMGTGGFRLMELKRGEADSFVWLDQTTQEAFLAMPGESSWGIVWQEGAAFVPVALVSLANGPKKARITHLIPGIHSEALDIGG